jgi:mono/diheme cytochrome c family protein
MILGLLLFSLVFAVAHGSGETWKDYQDAYVKKVSGIAGKDREDLSLGKKAIEIPELKVTDRCTSCHVPMDDPNTFGEDNPLKPHPSNYLKQHPSDRFGCTICHGGLGESLSAEEAQSETFRKGDLVQTSCTVCHGDTVLEGAEKITRGKSLLEKYQCVSCHYSEKVPQTDDFRPAPRLRGIASKVSEKWLLHWLKDPRSTQSNTVMPRYEIDEKYVDALVGYLMNSEDLPIRLAQAPLSRSLPQDEAICHYTKYRIVASC